MTRPFGFEIPPAPEKVDGKAVLARVVEGLAFRFFWATEGLRAEDYEFRPGPSSMSTKELLKHLLHLSFMVKQCVENASERDKNTSDDPEVLRSTTLEVLRGIRENLLALSDSTLERHVVLKSDGSSWPVWHIMNGPLADALTHVGQLNAWRRLNGNPVPEANVFAGTPPKGD
jgi:hypothetical protein